MAHQCERPDCAETATVAYGFDAARAVAWLETLDQDAPRHGRLCRRHAEAMVVPKGWWLEDRRAGEQLFVPSVASAPAVRRPSRARRATPYVSPLPLDPDPAAAVPPRPTWVPAFAADDDLGGVLNATSPLLARAFGNVKAAGTRARPPAPGT